MTTVASKTWDMLGVIRRGGKVRARHLRWIDADLFDRALAILHERDVRYVSFFGGETLLHPRLTEMIAMAVAKGMGHAVTTNGWLLPGQLDDLAATGLKTVYISIDAAAMGDHEANRGLRGLGARIRSATSRMPSLGMTPLAQVTMSKLIADYRTLVPLLRDLRFDAVTFSYPQRARLGSSSLAWSADSRLLNFTDSELVAAFDAVDDLRNVFPVNNPRASVADMKRHLRGEPERFVCYGGYKSFYLDWNYDIWRCDAWGKPMCSVWEFPDAPLIRDGCTACISDCYRDSSVMLHFARLAWRLHRPISGRACATGSQILMGPAQCALPGRCRRKRAHVVASRKARVTDSREVGLNHQNRRIKLEGRGRRAASGHGCN